MLPCTLSRDTKTHSRIRDPRLVAIWNLFVVCCAAYTIFFTVLTYKRYMITVRTSRDVFVTLGGSGVNSDVPMLDVTTENDTLKYPYCLMREDGLDGCVALDPDELFALNQAQSNSVYITTRVNEYSSQKVMPDYCDYANGCDVRGAWKSGRKYFLVGPEELEVWVDHSVWVQKLWEDSGKKHYLNQAATMYGELVDGDDDVLMSFPVDTSPVVCRAKDSPFYGTNDCVTNVTAADEAVHYVDEKSRRHTKLPVKMLLKAAGLDSLDQLTDMPGAEPWATYRYYGARLQMSIEYTNLHSTYSPSNYFEFKVRVDRLKEVEYHARSKDWVSRPGATTVYPSREWKKAGVSIQIQQRGRAHVVDIPTLLSALTTIFVLMGFARFLMKFLTLGLLGYSDKGAYEDVDPSDDFPTLCMYRLRGYKRKQYDVDVKWCERAPTPPPSPDHKELSQRGGVPPPLPPPLPPPIVPNMGEEEEEEGNSNNNNKTAVAEGDVGAEQRKVLGEDEVRSFIRAESATSDVPSPSSHQQGTIVEMRGDHDVNAQSSSPSSAVVLPGSVEADDDVPADQNSNNNNNNNNNNSVNSISQNATTVDSSVAVGNEPYIQEHSG
eukprot:PhM_4_TR17408/c1_g4_i1/m.82211